MTGRSGEKCEQVFRVHSVTGGYFHISSWWTTLVTHQRHGKEENSQEDVKSKITTTNFISWRDPVITNWTTSQSTETTKMSQVVLDFLVVVVLLSSQLPSAPINCSRSCNSFMAELFSGCCLTDWASSGAYLIYNFPTDCKKYPFRNDSFPNPRIGSSMSFLGHVSLLCIIVPTISAALVKHFCFCSSWFGDSFLNTSFPSIVHHSPLHLWWRVAHTDFLFDFVLQNEAEWELVWRESLVRSPTWHCFPPSLGVRQACVTVAEDYSISALLTDQLHFTTTSLLVFSWGICENVLYVLTSSKTCAFVTDYSRLSKAGQNDSCSFSLGMMSFVFVLWRIILIHHGDWRFLPLLPTPRWITNCKSWWNLPMDVTFVFRIVILVQWRDEWEEHCSSVFTVSEDIWYKTSKNYRVLNYRDSKVVQVLRVPFLNLSMKNIELSRLLPEWPRKARMDADSSQ